MFLKQLFFWFACSFVVGCFFLCLAGFFVGPTQGYQRSEIKITILT